MHTHHPEESVPRYLRYLAQTGSLILLILLLMHPLAWSAEKTPPAIYERVGIADEVFHLELAKNAYERASGLMFRSSIPESGGMLFVFPDDQRRNFWMKNCLVDMDILFLSRSGVVHTVLQMHAEKPRQDGESQTAYHSRLRRYPSGYPARFAIELKYGTADRLGISPGDRIDLDSRNLIKLVQ